MSSDPKGPEPKTDAEKLEDLRYFRLSSHEEWLVAQAHIGGWRQAEAFLRQRAGEHFAVSEDIPAMSLVDEVLAKHKPEPDSQAEYDNCSGCAGTWPCESVRLATKLKAAEAEVTRLRERLWHHHQADGLETDPHHCRYCQEAGGTTWT